MLFLVLFGFLNAFQNHVLSARKHMSEHAIMVNARWMSALRS